MVTSTGEIVSPHSTSRSQEEGGKRAGRQRTRSVEGRKDVQRRKDKKKVKDPLEKRGMPAPISAVCFGHAFMAASEPSS